MTKTERRLKQFAVENNFKQHLIQVGKWNGYVDDKMDISSVRQLISASLDYLCIIKRDNIVGEELTNHLIDWYQQVRNLFPSVELFQQFVEIVENNKCDYIPSSINSKYKDLGYINEEIEDKWWSR
jgi:hypothetical protein